MRTEKMGSPCSFLLYEQNCLLPSLTQLPNVPNKAITNKWVYKTVASNWLDMAESVELWTLDRTHSVAIRFRCSRGSLSCYVTTRSSYLKNLRFVQYFHRLLQSVQILLASIMLITRSLVAVEPRSPPLTDVGTETAFRLDQRKHFRKSKHFLRSEVSWCDQTRIDLHLRRSTCKLTNE